MFGNPSLTDVDATMLTFAFFVFEEEMAKQICKFSEFPGKLTFNVQKCLQGRTSTIVIKMLALYFLPNSEQGGGCKVYEHTITPTS